MNCSLSRARLGSNMVLGLFGAVLVLQLLDLHSTLNAHGWQHEGNRFIVWLSQRVARASVAGQAAAVVMVKAFDVLVLGAMYAWWRRSSGLFDREFAVTLTVLALVFLAVVANNYLG